AGHHQRQQPSRRDAVGTGARQRGTGAREDRLRHRRRSAGRARHAAPHVDRRGPAALRADLGGGGDAERRVRALAGRSAAHDGWRDHPRELTAAPRGRPTAMRRLLTIAAAVTMLASGAHKDAYIISTGDNTTYNMGSSIDQLLAVRKQ